MEHADTRLDDDDVVTATPDTSMLKISKMMKEYNIRRVPVVDSSHHVIGIVSDRDVKDASPSKATTLDMHELYYLLSEVKARDIMTPKSRYGQPQGHGGARCPAHSRARHRRSARCG